MPNLQLADSPAAHAVLPPRQARRTVAPVSDAAPPRRRGLGCLPSLVLLLVGGLAMAVLVLSIIGPWIYTVGGRTRLLPLWEGVGQAEGPGGTYTLFIWFSPSNSGSRILPTTAVLGYSTLCNPRGERLNLKLRGGARGRAWWTMEDGHEFALRLYRRPPFGGVAGGMVAPPRLTFEGRWQGPDLVMSDLGGFAHAFRPDGSVITTAPVWHPETNVVPITFHETSGFWLTAPACPRGAGRGGNRDDRSAELG